MTREEALEYIRIKDVYNQFDIFGFDTLVNDIYDDFEGIACENCKWFHEFVDGDAGYGSEWVSCDEIYMEMHNFDKTKDFCSRFVRKSND